MLTSTRFISSFEALVFIFSPTEWKILLSFFGEHALNTFPRYENTVESVTTFSPARYPFDKLELELRIVTYSDLEVEFRSFYGYKNESPKNLEIKQYRFKFES